ncbi:MAG: TetR/AcrR family transcriptional regulator [Gammaproteobacteria bacterium]|nr:TetR/AcrR family transcriptional regulator [Gammaproteobacteria bacterium]
MSDRSCETNTSLRVSVAEIPGVRTARQHRSRKLQDRFVLAGRTALQHRRLDDLPIPVLAEAAGSSVGGFYSRFSDKDTFFAFQVARMMDEHMQLFEEHLEPQRFVGKAHHDISTAFVDVMLLVYSGPWRGVLREAYAFISEKPAWWGPMLERGRLLRSRVTQLYIPVVQNPDGLDERVSVAVQLLFSALNNEMMNRKLAFGIDDEPFRHYLILMLDSIVTAEARQSKPFTKNTDNANV